MTVYQGSIDSHQDQGQNDHKTGSADTTKALFADQDLQMLTNNGYKDHKQFAGFVKIETACCNCKQLFLSGNKLHKHLKKKCP